MIHLKKTVFQYFSSFVTCNFLRMTTNLSYEEAIQKLNLLQSNKATIEQIKHDLKYNKEKCTNMENMTDCLSRIGITLPMLDQLSVIHIAGTKGKGSTSAMCESILRHHGFRTGFYSSPHLVAVRERVRLRGQTLSEEQFAKYFHHVYDKLNQTQAFEGDMPKYFAFMTVLAYFIFLKEKVDVAIVEVGIGGIVDYTNVLRKVPVVGITSLGLDHTSILGSTIEEIAAAKAGIMKVGCEAYTVTQPPGAMAVLEKVAEAVKCPLRIAPEYETYDFPNNLKPTLATDAYYCNASLAIQLAHAWMRTNKTISYTNNRIIENTADKKSFEKTNCMVYENNLKNNYLKEKILKTVPLETAMGLKKFKWPGRYQIMATDLGVFYLDGAHTQESMEMCVDWYLKVRSQPNKILIFSATGDRDIEKLLKPLIKVDFDTIYFVMPTAFKNKTEKSDNFSVIEQHETLKKCYKHADIWSKLQPKSSSANVVVLDCVSDVLDHIMKTVVNRQNNCILITGSLHLVGAALTILDTNT